jgi:predicted TIM-barrel fold metal-dependent hydrolase
MDAAGIDVQVLSLTAPGVEHFEPAAGTSLAQAVNDELAEVIERHPGRFLGLASLAPQAPQTAADELERAVKSLGFVGWKTHANYRGSHLDDEQYWPILERAAELGVPIFLHPTAPAWPALAKYGFALAGAPFGFGIEISVCMMRLIYSGIFDRFPALKIIPGHLGEGVPFLMQRIDFAYVRPWFDPAARPPLRKKPSDYLKENVLVATSGNYLPAAFACTREASGIDRILLGTDSPYEDSQECVHFLDALGLPKGDRQKIDYLNFARLRVERRADN